MTSEYSHSAYFNLRAAESFAEEDKLVQAENAYKAALASGSPAPCTHAEFGITLLRKKKVAEAREQFELETRSGSHCGLAVLGIAVAEVAEGNQDAALKGLASLSMADPGFVQSSLPLFHDAISADQARQLIELDAIATGRWSFEARRLPRSSRRHSFRMRRRSRRVPARRAGLPGWERRSRLPNAITPRVNMRSATRHLKPALHTLGSFQLQMLASCSFYTGDFRTVSIAAQRLKTNTATRVQGLYWESKADQQLAIAALIRAGEIDADSPRMHVLLGDIFRQQRQWHDAETEYRKAVALDPKSHAARLSLAIVLFTELKNDEAFDIGRSFWRKIRTTLRQISWRARSLSYKTTMRKLSRICPTAGISSWNSCLVYTPSWDGYMQRRTGFQQQFRSTRQDCQPMKMEAFTIQLGRLYQKTGDKNAAEEAFRESKRLSRQWDERARIALGQSSTGAGHQ